jgi:phosphoenolpyruvate carboxylase
MNKSANRPISTKIAIDGESEYKQALANNIDILNHAAQAVTDRRKRKYSRQTVK